MAFGVVMVLVRMIVVVLMGVALSCSVSLAHDVVGKDIFYNSRIKTEADEVFEGGGIEGDGDAIACDLQGQMAVAQFKSQTAHFFHCFDGNANQFGFFDSDGVDFICRDSKDIAIRKIFVNLDANFCAVIGNFQNAMSVRFEPFKGNVNDNL